MGYALMIEMGRCSRCYIFHKPNLRPGRVSFCDVFLRRGAVLRRARKASSSFTGARPSVEFFLRLRLVACFRLFPNQLIWACMSEGRVACVAWSMRGRLGGGDFCRVANPAPCFPYDGWMRSRGVNRAPHRAAPSADSLTDHSRTATPASSSP